LARVVGSHKLKATMKMSKRLVDFFRKNAIIVVGVKGLFSAKQFLTTTPFLEGITAPKLPF